MGRESTRIMSEFGVSLGSLGSKFIEKRTVRVWLQNVNLKGQCFLFHPEKHNRRQG